MAKKKASQEATLTTEDISALKQLIGLIPTLTQAVGVKKEEAPSIQAEEEPTPRRRSKSRKKNAVRRSTGVATRVESIKTNGTRPNLFEQSAVFNSFKEDRDVDQLLWKGRSISPRGERSTTVDVECDDCGDEYTVSPNELIKTTDENGRPESYYLCNDCIRNKRR